MVMETILTALLGGGTGILGTVIGKVATYFEKKQDMEMRLAEFAHEARLQEMQMASDQLERESEQAIQEMATYASTRKASYQHDDSYGKPYRWVITVLRLVRPFLTVLLIALTTLIFFNLAEGDRDEVASQVVFLTGMAISWWFGDRYTGSAKK